MKRCMAGAYLRASLFALFAVAATACASGGGGGGGSPDLITRDQIDALPEGTAFTVVQRYKSGWLRPRSQGSFTSNQPDFAVVFVDEMRYGDINSLSRISSNQIESIQYISATDATTRYGTGYTGGIIRVNTRGR